MNWGQYHQIEDNSSLTRLGLRYSLGDNSELRGLVSRQQTDQTDNWEWRERLSAVVSAMLHALRS